MTPRFLSWAMSEVEEAPVVVAIRSGESLLGALVAFAVTVGAVCVPFIFGGA